jgi:glycosidase
MRAGCRRPFLISLLSIALWSCSPPSSAGPDAGPGGGGDEPDARDPVDTPDASTPDTPDAYLPPTCTKAFVLNGYENATEVLLTGTLVSPAWAGTAADGAVSMTKTAGSWSVELELDPGSYEYKFVIDGTDWVADPGNPNTVDDGFGGVNSVYTCGTVASSCGDPDAFDWRDTVMYFAMVDRFYDSDGSADPVPGASGGDGNGNSGQYEGGDLEGVREKLPYLTDLGVTAIWLSAPFDNRDSAGAAIDGNDPHQYSGYHGYWPKPANVDYSDIGNPTPRPQVESRIGDEATLKQLIADAHGATSANGDGVKVLFDYVMNHVDVESGLYQAHNDWFARDTNGDFALCGPGNLWDDPYWGTRCAFTSYLPPFDFDNVDARNWSINDAIWWAKEFGIDGYRLDAIKHVPLSWLTELRSRLNSEFASPAGDRFYLVGETFDYFNRDLLKKFVNSDTMLDGQFDFPFKRELCEAVFNPGGRLDSFSGFMGGNDGFYDRGPDNRSIMTTWIGNHDIPRAIHFADWAFGNCTEGSHTGNGWTGNFGQPQSAAPYERLALAFAVMMTNPGIPLIYYGDEIGLAGGGDPGNRRMMVFENGQLNQHQIALRDKVKKLANLRGQLKVLGRGARTTLHADGDTWVYQMGGCGADFAEVVVAINRADAPRDVAIPAGDWYDEISESDVAGGADYSLPARSYLVLTPRP